MYIHVVCMMYKVQSTNKLMYVSLQSMNACHVYSCMYVYICVYVCMYVCMYVCKM